MHNESYQSWYRFTQRRKGMQSCKVVYPDFPNSPFNHTIVVLYISFFQLFHCLICCPCRKCHVQNGWALITRSGHTCAICDKNIFTLMQLVPFIKQGSVSVTAHSHTTH